MSWKEGDLVYQLLYERGKCEEIFLDREMELVLVFEIDGNWGRVKARNRDAGRSTYPSKPRRAPQSSKVDRI